MPARYSGFDANAMNAAGLDCSTSMAASHCSFPGPMRKLTTKTVEEQLAARILQEWHGVAHVELVCGFARNRLPGRNSRRGRVVRHVPEAQEIEHHHPAGDASHEEGPAGFLCGLKICLHLHSLPADRFNPGFEPWVRAIGLGHDLLGRQSAACCVLFCKLQEGGIRLSFEPGKVHCFHWADAARKQP